jgi:hypothetical protein
MGASLGSTETGRQLHAREFLPFVNRSLISLFMNGGCPVLSTLCCPVHSYRGQLCWRICGAHAFAHAPADCAACMA